MFDGDAAGRKAAIRTGGEMLAEGLAVRVARLPKEDDPDSLLNFYRRLVRFRKSTPVALYGSYRELDPNSRKLYTYLREYEGAKLLVVCSFTDDQVRFDAPEGLRLSEGKLVLFNYDMNFVIANGFTTRPYELRVYLFTAEEKV